MDLTEFGMRALDTYAAIMAEEIKRINNLKRERAQHEQGKDADTEAPDGESGEEPEAPTDSDGTGQGESTSDAEDTEQSGRDLPGESGE